MTLTCSPGCAERANFVYAALAQVAERHPSRVKRATRSRSPTTHRKHLVASYRPDHRDWPIAEQPARMRLAGGPSRQARAADSGRNE